MGDLAISQFEMHGESSIFATVRDLAGTLAPIDEELRQLAEWTAEATSRQEAAIAKAVQALGAPALGETVTATVIKKDKANPAICTYDLANYGTTYWGNTESMLYAPRNHVFYHREATGRLVGIDPWQKALVLKTRIPLTRIWVHLFDKNGENAVTLKVADPAAIHS